jgi:hypothetical protein
LPEIAQADGLLAFGFRSGQSGQEQARKDRNDRNHDQQFDKSEGTRAMRYQ